MNATISFVNDNKLNREYKGKSFIDFPEDYTLFDIETTGLDSDFDEIIEIGAIKVRRGEKVDFFQSLIKPEHEINDFITELTGITNEMVKDAPKVDCVLSDFMNFIGDDILIGHNVNFDINFVYDNLIHNNYNPITNDYIDTLRLARRILPELKHHRLVDLACYYKIDTNGNHRSLKDVDITYNIYKCLKEDAINKYNSIDAFIKYCNLKNHSHVKFSEIKANIDNIDEDNPFYGKYVAITGTLEKMQRKEAMQLIANLGGKCQDNVNKDTNFLILGNNDYNPQLKGQKSNKLIKAESLKIKGNDIEIVSENVFYDIINEYLNN